MSDRRAWPRVTRPPAVGSEADAALGGQHPWVWAVGLPYRALVMPWGGSVMPARPRADDDLFDTLGYFAALQSFLTYSFGWTRHDKGLIWWCDRGMPDEDPRFALIRDVWVVDGVLDRYIDWCVRHPVMNALDDFAAKHDRQPIALSPEWRRGLGGAREGTTEDPDSPYGKHLESGSHISGPSGRGAGRIVGADPISRSAIFVSENVAGWYAELARLAAQLGELPNGRSWRVDVFVKPIGYLGVYRQSRATALWFAGRHAHHVVGN